MTRLDTMMKRYPPFLRRDPDLLAINQVAANEFDLIEENMAQLMANFTPQNADLFLAFWEKLFKLPVNPPSKTVAQRRQTVVTFLRRLSSGGAGLNWVARLIDLIGPDWEYIVHTPDGIKGVMWERFLGAITSDWEWTTGSATGFDYGDPSGLIPNTPTPRRLVYKNTLLNQESLIQFEAGGKSSTEGVGAVVKLLSATEYLQVLWVDGVMYLQKIVAGTPTTLTSQAAALTIGERYWIRANVDDNLFVGEIWDSDPSKNNSDSPLFSKETTLAGGDATTFGTGKLGKAGVYWSGLDQDWLIRQVRINEVGFSVPANTLRVTIPFDGDNFRVLEVGILLRAITPANTAIEVFLDAGFILGVSRLGVQGF